VTSWHCRRGVVVVQDLECGELSGVQIKSAVGDTAQCRRLGLTLHLMTLCPHIP
jgi:hypothetical protein